MSEKIIGRDMYLRITTPTGISSVSYHRVWDADRFVASQQAHARQEAAKEQAEPSVVTIATADEYRNSAIRR